MLLIGVKDNKTFKMDKSGRLWKIEEGKRRLMFNMEDENLTFDEFCEFYTSDIKNWWCYGEKKSPDFDQNFEIG